MLSAIPSFFVAIWTQIYIWLAGLWALVRVIGIGIGALFGSTGTIASRLAAKLAAPEGQRLIFSFLRAFIPNLALPVKIITAYDNNGTVLVTRFDDVKDVLSRDGEFEVVYGPRMEKLTGGANFFLGMQDTPTYTRDTSNMRLAMRREDVARVITPYANKRSAELVAAKPGRIDVPQDLTLRVPSGIVGGYFGVPGPSEQDLIDWTTIMFWYLFIDLKADAALDARTMDAAAKCRAYLDGAIAARKANPTTDDDVLNRCLNLQKAGEPGMDDLGIRNNLIGLMIGCVPTLSKASVQALDQLLDRPDALAKAQAAARANDDATVAQYCWEAMRFNPVNPLIYRRAAVDATVAANRFRRVQIKKGAMVMAVNLSAMFDPLKVDSPSSFRAGRPWDDYILWGDGLHTCFGAHINLVVIPAMLKPLLAKKNLRRAAGAAGQIDNGGTPFPQHLVVEYDGD
jgi:cytochrome P450